MINPYSDWLGIADSRIPPNHYELLGLRLFEDDHQVIEQARDARVVLLQDMSVGTKHIALAQKMLTEVAAASICLLDREKKQRYDDALKEHKELDQLEETSELDIELGWEPEFQKAAPPSVPQNAPPDVPQESQQGQLTDIQPVKPVIRSAAAKKPNSYRNKNLQTYLPWIVVSVTMLMLISVGAIFLFSLLPHRDDDAGQIAKTKEKRKPLKTEKQKHEKSNRNKNPVRKKSSKTQVLKFSTAFEKGWPERLYKDNPSKGLCQFRIANGSLEVFATKPGGQADLWLTRDGAPIAWTFSPKPNKEGKWFAETFVKFEKNGIHRAAGIVVYPNQDGIGGCDDRMEFILQLNDWDDRGIEVDWLGDRKPEKNYGGPHIDNAYIRLEVTERGETDYYEAFFKRSKEASWIRFARFESAVGNSRVGLFLKFGPTCPLEQRKVKFGEFHVGVIRK